MKNIALALLASFAILLSGCSSKAGPFITNISSDGNGGIVVEKCMVKFDRQLSVVENSDCNNHNIKLSPIK